MKIVSYSNAPDREHFVTEFSLLPEKTREGSARVGLLPAPVWRQFLAMVPPALGEFWIAEENGKTVGRIGANLLPSYASTGAFGFFEVDVKAANSKNVVEELVSAATAWLKARKASKMVGPLNINTWFPYRFRTSFDDKHCFMWEPVNPEDYPKYFEALGFQTCETYHSIGTQGLEGFCEKVKGAFSKAEEAGFTFRPIDTSALLTKEVPVLYEISMSGFKDNYLFEPIPLPMFRELYVPLANKSLVSHSYFVLDTKGKEVGFLFAFVDGDSLILKSATVLESYRGLGLSNALMHLAAKEALKSGLHKYTSALVRTGNRSESYSKKGETLWVHEYKLLEKAI